MPDITMCLGKETIDGKEVVCPRAEQCYRHTAKPTPLRQSYFAKLPMLLPDGTCHHFWPADVRDKTKR